MPAPSLITLGPGSAILVPFTQLMGSARESTAGLHSGIVGFKLAALQDGANPLRQKSDLLHLSFFMVGNFEYKRGRGSVVLCEGFERYTDYAVDVIVQSTAGICGLASNFGDEALGTALEGVHPVDHVALFRRRERLCLGASLRQIWVLFWHWGRCNSVISLKICL